MSDKLTCQYCQIYIGDGKMIANWNPEQQGINNNPGSCRNCQEKNREMRLGIEEREKRERRERMKARKST